MSDLKLPPIVVRKTPELLARELRQRILSGALAPGTSLPAERELVAQTGLSRGSVREALRILETEHLVTTRTGRHGGSVARQPGDEALVRYIGMFVHSHGITLQSLMQTREAIEPALAALAATHRDEDELQELVEAAASVEQAITDTPRFLRENIRWHGAIAEASHNPLLRAVMAAISSLIYQASTSEVFANPEVRQQGIAAHRGIVRAIAAGDAEGARRRMARHLAAVSAAIDATPRAALARLVPEGVA